MYISISCQFLLWTIKLFSNMRNLVLVVFCLPIRGEDGCFLYGVFNGYDGSRVASFASQCLTAELLLGQLNSNHTDNDVRRILTQVGMLSYCMFIITKQCNVVAK